MPSSKKHHPCKKNTWKPSISKAAQPQGTARPFSPGGILLKQIRRTLTQTKITQWATTTDWWKMFKRPFQMTKTKFKIVHHQTENPLKHSTRTREYSMEDMKRSMSSELRNMNLLSRWIIPERRLVSISSETATHKLSISLPLTLKITWLSKPWLQWTA